MFKISLSLPPGNHFFPLERLIKALIAVRMNGLPKDEGTLVDAFIFYNAKISEECELSNRNKRNSLCNSFGVLISRGVEEWECEWEGRCLCGACCSLGGRENLGIVLGLNESLRMAVFDVGRREEDGHKGGEGSWEVFKWRETECGWKRVGSCLCGCWGAIGEVCSWGVGSE
ncbi:hypothetical protein Tco_0967959 [Tanacetum coccineum]